MSAKEPGRLKVLHEVKKGHRELHLTDGFFRIKLEHRVSLIAAAK